VFDFLVALPIVLGAETPHSHGGARDPFPHAPNPITLSSSFACGVESVEEGRQRWRKPGARRRINEGGGCGPSNQVRVSRFGTATTMGNSDELL
jgi:hypothetical protein